MALRPAWLLALCAAAVLAAERPAGPGEVQELAPAAASRHYTRRFSPSLGEAAGTAEAQSATEEGVELVGGLVKPEAGGASVAGAEANPSEAPLAQAGMAVLDSYKTLQSKLLKRSEQLRQLHDRPPKPAQSVTYDKIPGMIMRRGSRDASPDSRVGCEQTCNRYAACLAYSYNEAKQACLWTTEAVHYKPGSEFFLKKHSAFGQVQLEYAFLPGLDVDVDGTSPVTEEECKYECSESKGCSGFGYTAQTKTCKKASDKYLEFDSAWLYFEKNVIEKLPPKEKEPVVELSELQNKKVVFSRNLDVTRKMHAERGDKAAKKREFLRQRTIDAEKQLKTLQADQIAASNKFEPFEIQYEALKTNYDSEKKRQGGMSAAGAKLKERVKSLKNEMHLATTKEAKEKSSIDYQYFQNKLSTQKLESTEVDQNVKRLAPQVRESHVKLTSARSEYLQAVKDYREGKWQIAYDEAQHFQPP